VVTAADAERLRLAQAGIRALVVRDLEAFFTSLNLGQPESARDALLEFMPVLVSSYGESAAAMAADWYDEVRASEGVPGRYRAQIAVPDQSEAAVDTVRRAAAALFTDSPATTLLSLTAAAPKYALTGSRETIVRSTDRDPRAVGWQRVVRSGACRFCRMLHGRGAVYKESTALFAAHKECNCAAAPSWDPDAPEVDAFAYDASSGRMAGLRRAAENGDPGAQRRLDEYRARLGAYLDDNYGTD